MKLNEIKDNEGARKSRTRVGRGMGSGKGKTSGSGQKGQTSRSGVAIKGFEGGQMPLYQRLPKRGFTNHTRKIYAEVNIGRVQEAIDTKKLDANKTIDAQALKDSGIVTHIREGIRLLGNGDIKTKVTFSVSGATKTAIQAVEKVGGKVELLVAKETKVRKEDKLAKKTK